MQLWRWYTMQPDVTWLQVSYNFCHVIRQNHRCAGWANYEDCNSVSFRMPTTRYWLTWGGGCFAVCVERRHVPADLRATMDCMWMKYSSTLTYLSGRRFLQGGPQEITLTCQPVATLPASFSIKQANNTIPTPINKSAFLNKVQYTGSL